MTDAKARLLQMIADEPHMAGGGAPHWSMGNPEQFVKNKSERLYPKLERMNPAAKAVKNQVDAFNRLVDQGVPIKDLVGGLVGAVPFVGPDMRKRMEGATLNFPTGFERSKTNPQVATGRIDTAPAKVSDILGELKPSDFTGTKGMSNVLHDVGRGYPPNVLDVLDTLGMDITGFGGVGIDTAIKGGRKAAGALSNLAKSEAGYKLAQKALEYVPGAQPMYAVKQKGGNWVDTEVKRHLDRFKNDEDYSPLLVNSSKQDLAEIEKNPSAYQNPAAEVEILRSDIAHMEQTNAFNKWVDSKAGSYVRNQMGTPDDPVVKSIDMRVMKAQADLEAGQKRLASLDGRIAEAEKTAVTPEELNQLEGMKRNRSQRAAELQNNYDLTLDTMLPGGKSNEGYQYLRDSFAYLKANRRDAGFPAAGLAQTRPGKAWEAVTDAAIGSNPADVYQNQGAKFLAVENAQNVYNQYRKEELPERFRAFVNNQPDLSPTTKRNFINNADARVMASTLGELERHEKLVDDIYQARQKADSDAFEGAKNNPYLNKLAPETPVYTSLGLNELGIDHVIDVLKQDVAAGNIKLEDLNKITMEQALKRASEYDLDLAKKARDSLGASRAAMPVYKEYPEGYRWVQLTKPGEFRQESEEMGHSVRGYEPPKGHPDWSPASENSGSLQYGHGGWEAIKSGRAKVYSLVDANHKPHVTVEVLSEGMTPEQRTYKVGILTQRLIDEGNAPEQAAAQAAKIYPEGENKQFITQIKGKGNGRPVPKYDQYTQDFVQSGKWADVGRDLDYTGLQKYGDEYFTPTQAEAKFKPQITEALNFLDTHPALDEHRAASKAYFDFNGDVFSPEYREIERAAGRPISSNVPYTYKELKALLQSPEDWTERGETIYTPISTALKNLNNAKKELGIDIPEEPRMAEGGEVKSFFEEKSAKQRLMDMIAKEPHMDNGPYIGSELMPRPLPLQLQGDITNDAFGGVGIGGRANYAHPIGKDAAIRAYIEGGGYKPKDMDYKGQVNNMGISYEKEFKDGGDVHMAGGGGLLKAIGTAQKTAKKAKMFSAVDKALETSKRGAGTGMEFANELAKTSGIKKAELVDRGIMVPSKNGPVLNPALTQLPKMTKQDFVLHLNEKYKPPGVRKITLGNVKFDQLSDQDLYNEYFRIRGSGPEAYGERMSREDILDELSGVPEEDATKAKYIQYKLPGSENYRENLYQYENPTGKAFYQSHFEEPNVLYHMRQADRIEPTYTNEQIYGIGQRMADAMGTKVENLGSGAPQAMMQKGVISPVEAAQFAHAKGFRNMDIDMSPAQRRALHIEEIQSDWHQKGRDKGYKQVEENVYDKEYDSYIQDLKNRYFERLKETYAPGEADPVKASFEIRRNMTPEADPQKIAETMGELDTLQDKFAAMYQERQAENVGVPNAPFKKSWHEQALKQALMDAVEGDYDQLLITPGAEQSKRFDLSKQISKVRYFDEPNSDSGLLHAYDLEGNNVLSQRIPKEKVQDYIGKDAAEKLLSQTAKENERTGFPSQERTLSGLDLQVGGEGMAGFYDKMVPSYLNDIGKKYGVRVGERAIEGDVPHSVTIPSIADANRIGGEMFGITDFNLLSKEQFDMVRKAFDEQARAAYTTKLHTFDITPEMREDILNNGLPMYQRGGEVHMGRGGILGAISKAQDTTKAAEKAAEAAAKAAKVDHPLVFPRAQAKTLEDIRPIAQRMAEQMTGEFVKQNPKVTTNPAGKSRKQFERERSIPLETRNVVPERPAPDVNYEDYMGYGLVGVPGDPTMGGVAKRGSLEATAQPTVELTRVGDITPDYPVPLFGGPRYGDDEKFWASGLSAAIPIQNNVTELAKLYEAPVLGKYIKMGEGSENFALHNLDALLSIQRPEKLNKAKMAQLTELIQAGSPKYGKFPGFTGFKDPADVLLQAQMDSKLRKHIAETLRKPTITDQLGLPNGLDVVAAITHPELRNLETGASGFSVGKMSPKSDLRQFQSSHPSYDTDIPGLFLGRSRYPTPYEIAFPDTTAYARSQMTPGVQEFNMMKMLGPRERIDQQYIDEMKMYEQLMKQYTGKKKGGLAHTKKVKRHGNTVSN